MKSTPPHAAWLLPIGAGICWGLIGPFVRHLDAAGLTGMEIIAVRAAVTALVLFPWMAFRNPGALRVRARDIWCFLGTGLGSIVFFNWCYFATITAASLSVACTLMYGAPAFVLLMSAIFFREPLTPKKLLVCILAFLGCALVSGWLAPGQIRSRIESEAPMPYSQRRKNCEPRSDSRERKSCAANRARTLLAWIAGSPVSVSKRRQSGSLACCSAPKLS